LVKHATGACAIAGSTEKELLAVIVLKITEDTRMSQQWILFEAKHFENESLEACEWVLGHIADNNFRKRVDKE
jgi:hypothetical protein